MNPNKHTLISTDVFFQDNFGIDEYLSKCTQKSDLLTLKKDLKNYGSELYTVMVDILKTETEDIINLAENLTNLNSRIDDLSTPVSQLCEEIRTLYLTIINTKLHFKKHLDIVHSLGAEKDILNLQMGIISSSAYINNVIFSWEEGDITILERAVNEYSFQYLYLKELGLNAVIFDEDVQSTASRLIELVNIVFLEALKMNNEESLLRCLRMYMNLGRETEAEVVLKQKIVQPILRVIFTQKNLDDHGQDVDPLYKQAMQFLNGDLKSLFTVVDRNPDLKKFNFIINSFWVEVDKQLRENLPNITAPGNPEQFQKRFQNTWHFLQEILIASKNPLLFQEDPSFEAHMKRFNLPVYFEIRFQQIAAKFESDMFDPLTELNKIEQVTQTTDNLFKLRISSTLWSSIKRCFDEEVFLIHLADQIIKLTMLLLSRYLKWFDGYLIKWKVSTEQLEYHEVEQFIVYSLADLSILKSLIGFSTDNTEELDKTIFKIIPKKIQFSILKVLQVNGSMLDNMYSKLQKQLVNFKVQQCLPFLQQVTSIPRLYRRTNRHIPKEPSNYVIEAVAPITKLQSNYETIRNDNMLNIIDIIIARLSEQYLSLVQEVLRSVCKTEESLRRLKNRSLHITEDSTVQPSGDTTSDENKIREQIKLDVGYFIKQMKPFVLKSSKHSIKLLNDESGYASSK